MTPHCSSLLTHPDVLLQPLAYITAFALVFKTNVAYNRYWESATSSTTMSSKWGDAAALALSFNEFSSAEEAKKDASAVQLERCQFEALTLHQFSLMHACALQYLRRDLDLDHIVEAPCESVHSANYLHSVMRRSHIEWQNLAVIGGLSESEKVHLRMSDDRVASQMSSILRQFNTRRASGGLWVDAPTLSRVYQVIAQSDNSSFIYSSKHRSCLHV